MSTRCSFGSVSGPGPSRIRAEPVRTGPGADPPVRERRAPGPSSERAIERLDMGEPQPECDSAKASSDWPRIRTAELLPHAVEDGAEGRPFTRESPRERPRAHAKLVGHREDRRCRPRGAPSTPTSRTRLLIVGCCARLLHRPLHVLAEHDVEGGVRAGERRLQVLAVERESVARSARIAARRPRRSAHIRSCSRLRVRQPALDSASAVDGGRTWFAYQALIVKSRMGLGAGMRSRALPSHAIPPSSRTLSTSLYARMYRSATAARFAHRGRRMDRVVERSGAPSGITRAALRPRSGSPVDRDLADGQVVCDRRRDPARRIDRLSLLSLWSERIRRSRGPEQTAERIAPSSRGHPCQHHFAPPQYGSPDRSHQFRSAQSPVVRAHPSPRTSIRVASASPGMPSFGLASST